MTPTTPERIAGLIEVPELAACLTLNKGDFIRTRRARRNLSRFSQGDSASRRQTTRRLGRRAGQRATKRRRAKCVRCSAISPICWKTWPLDFPLLASLVERRAGGQKRLPHSETRATKTKREPSSPRR